MRELERKNIREDLFNAIMHIEGWTAHLRDKVIQEIKESFKERDHE